MSRQEPRLPDDVTQGTGLYPDLRTLGSVSKTLYLTPLRPSSSLSDRPTGAQVESSVVNEDT